MVRSHCVIGACFSALSCLAFSRLDVRAADAKRVEELGFDVKWDTIPTHSKAMSTGLTHREAGKMTSPTIRYHPWRSRILRECPTSHARS